MLEIDSVSFDVCNFLFSLPVKPLQLYCMYVLPTTRAPPLALSFNPLPYTPVPLSRDTTSTLANQCVFRSDTSCMLLSRISSLIGTLATVEDGVAVCVCVRNIVCVRVSCLPS